MNLEWKRLCSTFGAFWRCRIDFNIDFASIIDSNLNLGYVAFESKHDLDTEIYYSTHLYENVFKYKSLYIQLTFK
jgi:hypothetical protein